MQFKLDTSDIKHNGWETGSFYNWKQPEFTFLFEKVANLLIQKDGSGEMENGVFKIYFLVFRPMTS